MKANPKDKGGDDAAPSGGRSKKMILIIAAVAVLGLGGGAAWYFTAGQHAEEGDKKAHKKEKKAVPPEYIALEPFTVNLQPENGEQFLQIQLTLQIAGSEQAELVKSNMAKVRSRVLLLLSSKRASEINTTEGKQQLAKEIVEAVRTPFTEKGEPQEVDDVLFTAFIIQ